MTALRLARQTRQLIPGTRTLFTRAPVPPPSPIRTGIYATVFTLSAGLFAFYYFDSRSALHRYITTPVIRYSLDAETGHQLAVKVLRSGLSPRDPLSDDERLQAQIWDQQVSNPIGLAAGFDKDGEAIDGLFNLGFSWVEIGSVTPKPQAGNPRPRVFHLPDDDGLINRYGFPSQGHAFVLSRLRARIPKFFSRSESREESTAALRTGSLLAVNLGKNKESPADSIDDFVAGVRTFGPHSDVLVVNISSPNTPGLRGLQNKDVLEKLLEGVTHARDGLNSTSPKPKLVLKLAPDLDEAQLIDIAAVIRRSSIDGVIISNTTIRRPESLIHPNKTETGGLSGAPIKPYSLQALRTLRAQLPASIPLIGCGGITSGADALEYARAGASLVQIYTSFGYDGPGACRRIKDEVVKLLEQEENGATWSQVVEKAVDELSYREPPITEAPAGIPQLIEQAQELKRLLDTLGDRMQDEVAPSSAIGSSTNLPTVASTS